VRVVEGGSFGDDYADVDGCHGCGSGLAMARVSCGSFRRFFLVGDTLVFLCVSKTDLWMRCPGVGDRRAILDISYGFEV
jgi:hypothetical protein